MRVADTSFLFALHDGLDRFHEEAVAASRKADPVRLPVEVVAETLGLIHHRHGFAHAQGALRSWRHAPHFQFETNGAPNGAEDAFDAGDGRFTWVDAAVVAWARHHKATALTFDGRILAELGQER